jgi:hypothetical protein
MWSTIVTKSDINWYFVIVLEIPKDHKGPFMMLVFYGAETGRFVDLDTGIDDANHESRTMAAIASRTATKRDIPTSK